VGCGPAGGHCIALRATSSAAPPQPAGVGLFSGNFSRFSFPSLFQPRARVRTIARPRAFASPLCAARSWSVSSLQYTSSVRFFARARAVRLHAAGARRTSRTRRDDVLSASSVLGAAVRAARLRARFLADGCTKKSAAASVC
jgi:hypothetical protein